MDKVISSINVKVQAITYLNDGTFAIGLKGGEIIEYKNRVCKVIMRGHSKKNIKGKLLTFLINYLGICLDP